MAAGTLVVDNIENGLGNVGKTEDMIFGSAKAWIFFDGTGTVSIRDSYNVSSITDGGTGIYTINFATPFANTNYNSILTGSGSHLAFDYSNNTPRTLSALKIGVYSTANAFVDEALCSGAVFSN